MKTAIFISAVALAVMASCNPSYKATDTSKSTTSGNPSTTDNTTPGSTTNSSTGQTTPPGTTTSTSTVITVPAGTQTVFTTQYPNATNPVWGHYDSLATSPIDWEMTGWTAMDNQDYVVQFTMDNENYYAWYDSDGNWIGSTYALKDHTKLPAAVHTAVKSKYADYTITDVDAEFAKGKTAYEIEMKKDTSKVKLLIDTDGNIIKEKIK